MPLAQALYPEARLAERHQRDLLLMQGEAVVENLERIGVAVDLDVKAGEAGMDLHAHARGRRDDERRGAAAVHGQRRAHQGGRTGGEQRAAGGHRVGARSEWGREDQPVPGEPHVQLLVDRDVDDHLSGASANDHEVIDRPLLPRTGGMDRERRKAAGRPVVVTHAFQGLVDRIRVHCRERAEASTCHSQHRCVVGRRRAQGREHGAVAAERDHEIAGLELSSWRDVAVPPAVSHDVDDLQAVRPGPALECLERRGDRARRVNHQGDTRRLLIGDHAADPNQQWPRRSSTSAAGCDTPGSGRGEDSRRTPLPCGAG